MPPEIPGHRARSECDVTPSRPRILGSGQQQQDTNSCGSFTANHPAKKAGCGRAAGSGGRQVGSGNRPAALLCFAGHTGYGGTLGVSQSFMQLIGYVVLAAIILGTGFGAL
jgi:hypothetical protein